MSELDDAADFASRIEAAPRDGAAGDEAQLKTKPKGRIPSLNYADEEDGEKIAPGTMVQYSLYKDGYCPTTPTIKTLQSASYEIVADRNDVTYAKRMDPSSGLLLELPEMRSQAVLDIVDIFWNSESDYKQGNEFVTGGAAYRAGIMLYGPPGSGKSCTIKLIARKLVDRGGVVLYSSLNPYYVNKFLTAFGQVEKNRKCVVILEDIDSLIENNGESEYLEMLDSAKTINNVMFIATTNYPEKLDPRIYNRPGRFSHIIHVGLPSAVTREAYLKAILKDHRDVEFIVKKSEGFTIDHLTALVNAVYREKKNLEKEIERLRILFKVPKTDDLKPKMGIAINPED